VGTETVEELHAPCERAASVPGSPVARLPVDGPAILWESPACAEAAKSCFAVGEGCHPYLYGDNLVTATHSHSSPFTGLVTLHMLRFVIVWDVLVTG